MNNKRVDKLILAARRLTENEEFSDTSGIGDEELLQYINDGQYRIFSLITEKHPNVFLKESPLITVVKDQEAYPFPDDIFLENRIRTVEYSPTSLAKNLVRLRAASLESRTVSFSGFPDSYIRRSGEVLLSPIPNQAGVLRFNYQRRIASLDKRRGKISAVTLDNTAKTITSLTIDVSQSDFDLGELSSNDFICIINVKGDQQMTRIQLDSINSSTGVVTVNSDFVFEEGETITVGDYVTIGYNSSTHSELPVVCERYLIAYLGWKIFKRDSSEDNFEQRNELKSMETDIIASFSDITDDITYIPMISSEDV